MAALNKYPSFGAMPRLHHDPHTAVLREQLSLFYREQRYVDIILQCEGQEFPSHRVVLAAYSTMFSSLLAATGHMQGNMRVHHLSVDNYNIRAVDLCALLGFMYTGRMDKHLVNSNSIKYTATVLGMLVFQQYADNFSHDHIPFKPEGFDFSAGHIPHRQDPNSALGLPIPPAELLPPLAHNTLMHPQAPPNLMMPPQPGTEFNASNDHNKFMDYTGTVIDNTYPPQLDYTMPETKTDTANQLYQESDDDFPDFGSDVAEPACSSGQGDSGPRNTTTVKKPVISNSHTNSEPAKKTAHVSKPREIVAPQPIKPPSFPLSTSNDQQLESFVNIVPLEQTAAIVPEDAYACDLCGQTFKALSSLNGHMAVHPQKERGVQKFICEICDKVFATKKGCTMHIEKHACTATMTGGVFCCVKCSAVFDSRPTFATHLQTHNRSFRMNPTIVASGFPLEQEVGRNSLPTPKLSINTVEKSSRRKRKAKVNYGDDENPESKLLAENLEVFSCEVCEAEYYTQSELNGHMSKHKNWLSPRMKRYKCDICEKVFNTRQGGIQHVERYSLRSASRCVKCKQKFETKNELRVHLRQHLSVISASRYRIEDSDEDDDVFQKKLNLRKCPRKIKRTWYSRDRKQKHKALSVKIKALKPKESPGSKPNKKYQCLLCGKVYCTRHGVRYHLDRHANESEHVDGRYHCPCGQNFAGKIGLKIHIRAHRKTVSVAQIVGNTFQYIQCNLCMKIFETNDSLHIHLTKHFSCRMLAKKKFNCRKCSVQNNDLMAWNEHLAEHGRAMLFHICHLCKKQLPSKLKWKRHLQNHYLKFPLRCAHCPSVFSHYVSFAMHQRVHPQPERMLAGPHHCNQCEASFGTIFELYGHQVTHPSNVRNCIHTCNACSQPFESAEQLREHEQCHLLSVQCPQCQLRLRSHTDLERHSRRCQLKMRHDRPIYQCPTCLLVLGSVKGLHLHYQLHTLPFVCKACGAKYESINALHWHQRLSHGVIFEVDKTTVTGQMRKPLTCSKCGANFVNKRARYDAHMMQHAIHSKGNPTQCRSCLKVFSSKRGLRIHKKRGCLGPGKRRRKCARLPHTCMCSQCGKGFARIHQLEVHEATHSESVKFHCPKCNKGFYHKTPFSQHKRLCLNPKQYICPICGKILSKAETLENHLMLHTGEKPHKCSLCGQGYRQPYSLQNHIRREHTKERPFQCDICKAAFTSKSALRNHSKGKHSVIKPYACEICGKRYGYNSHLKEHRFTHTGQSPYPCAVCGKGFMVNKKRDQHMRADHPEYQNLVPQAYNM